MCATKDQLREPTQGYTASGFSFTAKMLFHELSELCSDFKYEEPESSNTPAGKFSRIWPDSISSEEMQRDFGFVSLSFAVLIADWLSIHKMQSSLSGTRPRFSSAKTVGRGSKNLKKLFCSLTCMTSKKLR